MSDGSFKVSRRWVLAGLLSGVADVALGDTLARSPMPRARPGEVRVSRVPSAEALIAKAALGGKIGFVVADARTGAVLESHNPLLALPPASTAKTITTLYALDALGGGYRFRTQLVATGPVSGGRIQGDLVLVGSGDPVLNTDDLGELASRLKAAGVREVTGAFRYYDRVLPKLETIDPGQPDHVGYNPAISGLNLNFNRVHFEWKRAQSGWSVSMDARAARFRPEVSVARMRVVQRAAPIYTYASAKGVDQWTVASAALGKGGSRWLPVRKPGAYAAEVFQTLARSYGIRLPRAVAATGGAPHGTVLAERASPPLNDILREMLKYSTNVTAEIVGMTATRARSGKVPASLASSAGQMQSWLSGTIGGGKARFVDHSGLEPQSHIPASDMVRALVWDRPKGQLRGLMKEIPMRDTQGKVVKNHPVKIQAKTGTLNFVSALTGYVSAPDGSELAFAIFTANEARRSRIPRVERERPDGARGWARRSRTLQGALIARWAALYGK